MEYIISKNKKKFELFEKSDNSPISFLEYESWYSSEAKFEINKNYYRIIANNSWQTKFDVFCNHTDIGDIDYNWKGDVIIRLKNNESLTKHFILKIKSLWTSTYELRDYLTNQIFIIKPTFNWKSLSYDFHITQGENYHEHDNNVNETLLFLVIFYAVNLYMKSSGAAS
jgi:hypothetical protein